MPTYARDVLLAHLKRVQPALAKTAFVPLFQSVFFTPLGVLAYNDQLGMLTQLDDCPRMAVPGLPLIRLLDASSVREVSFELDNERLRVRAGGMRASFPVDTGEPPIRWPGMPTEGLDITPELLDAFRLALRVADPQSLRMQPRGISVMHYDDESLAVYALDGPTLLRVLVPGSLGSSRAAILPIPFVEQLVKHSDGTGRLGFSESLTGNAYVMFEDADLSMFAKLLTPDYAYDFEGVLGAKWPADFALLPEGFDAALDRAMVIAKQAVEGENYKTSFEIAHGRLTLTTRVTMGEVVDEFPTEHPAARLSVDSENLARMMGRGPDQFGMADGAFMLASESVAYVAVGAAP